MNAFPKYIAFFLLSLLVATRCGAALTNDDATTPSLASYSAVYYVRSGATGNGSGSDWNNAMTDLPSSMHRGALYLLADGSYGAHNFQDASSGTTLITIKKADPGFHGTDVGWNATNMGSAQAVFTAPLTYYASYYVIDGSYRDTGWRSSYGIKVYNSTGAGRAIDLSPLYMNDGGYYSTNIFSYLEVQGNGMGSAAIDRGIYAFYELACTIQYCYLHDFGNCPILTSGCNNWTVQYSVIARNTQTAANHADGWSDQGSSNIIIRNNIWEDIEGTAVICALGRNNNITEELNWSIYGNVFSYSPGNPYHQTGLTDGVIACLDGGTGGNYTGTPLGFTNWEYAVNWYVYNNSIINLKGSFSSCVEIGIAPPPGIPNNQNVQVFNNFWYACDPAVNVMGACTGCSVGNNRYDATTYNTGEAGAEVNATANPSIFANYASKDFQLSKDTLPGQTLPAPYNVDMDGILRGADGTWDKGAYQLTGDVLVETNPPSTGVPNGGFETGDFSDWTLSGVTAGNAVTTTYAHSGNYGAQLGSTGGLGYLSQYVTTTPGSYTLSFWLESPDGRTPNEFLVSWNGNILFDETNIGITGWTNLQFTVTATNSSSRLSFGFRDDPTALGLDDISLTPLAQAPAFLLTGGAMGMAANHFGFNITGTNGMTVVIEACTNIQNAVWLPIATNTLAGTTSYFSDTQAPNYPNRYYRLRSP